VPNEIAFGINHFKVRLSKAHLDSAKCFVTVKKKSVNLVRNKASGCICIQYCATMSQNR
jgi:hypothetical protein